MELLALQAARWSIIGQMLDDTHTESREMLGVPAKLRENALCYLPVTRTRRSPRMRLTLPLVMCHDQGDEETVTDVLTLNKHHQRIEHLGLTLAESKQLLSTALSSC